MVMKLLLMFTNNYLRLVAAFAKLSSMDDRERRRIQVIKLFYQCNGSIIATIRKWRQLRLPSVPYALEVRRIVQRFENSGDVKNKKIPGRRRTQTSIRKREIVSAIAKDQWISCKQVRELADISLTSAHRIMRRDLKLYPYRTLKVQKLLPNDPEVRVQLCSDFLDIRYNCELNNLLFVDECTFFTDGNVSTNYRYWSQKPPPSGGLHELHV